VVKPACLFCAIVSGDTPATRVGEDDGSVAFLDIHPLFLGHTLVVPRLHTETLGDLPAERVEPFFSFVKRIAVAVEQGLGAGGTFVAINNRVSQSVPHLHAHVVPRTKGDGLKGFFWPRTKYESLEHAGAIAAQIRARLAG